MRLGHYVLGFSGTAARCSHFSYLCWINGLNYVIPREWDLTEKEKWIMKDCLAFNKTKIAALLDTTTTALQLTREFHTRLPH